LVRDDAEQNGGRIAQEDVMIEVAVQLAAAAG
jgi:hypothetical protein